MNESGLSEYELLVPGEETDTVPCPICGSTPIRSQEYMYVMSFLVITRHSTYQAALCRGCATNQGLKELAKSAILGWWGVPWGLLTLRAIWINVRSLARWSLIPAVLSPLLAVAGLGLPLAVGYAFFHSSQEKEAAKASGDIVPDIVAKLVEQGHRRIERDDLEGAQEVYLMAYKIAPDSSVINSSLAWTYYSSGDTFSALEYSRRADQLSSGKVSNVAMHGALELMMGHSEKAEECADRLAQMSIDDSTAASWAVELFFGLERWEEVLPIVELGIDDEPESVRYHFVQLFSLLALNRSEELRTALDARGEAARQNPAIAMMPMVEQFQQEPLKHLTWLTESWMDDSRSQFDSLLVSAAERSGHMPEIRHAIRSWLHDPATPGDAWSTAKPWFEEETWPQVLDTYLAERAEPAPGFQRLLTMDPVRERDRYLALAERIRGQEHPLQYVIEGNYFAIAALGVSRERSNAELAAHVARKPGHHHCKLMLANGLIDTEPAAARSVIDELGVSPQENPAFGKAVQLVDEELMVVEGRLDEARVIADSIGPWDPFPFFGSQTVYLRSAEIALYRGESELLTRGVAAVLDGEDVRYHGAALVLRWTAQVAAREPVTYQADVDRLLEHPIEELQDFTSASLQGILLAEGKVDKSWVDQLVGNGYPEAIRWVAWLKNTAETGHPDRSALAAIAESDHPSDWASRLAHHVSSNLDDEV